MSTTEQSPSPAPRGPDAGAGAGADAVGGRLARAGLWSVAGKMAAKSVDLLSLVVLAQILSPADFGLVAKATAVILILEATTDMPVAQPILRVRAPSRALYDTAFTLTMLRALLIGAIVAALAWPVAAYFQEPRLPPLLAALALAPVLRGSVSPRMTEFLRRYDMRPEALSDILSKLVSFVTVVGIALATGSYWAIAAGTITTTVVLNVMSYILAPYRPRLSLACWREFVDVLGWNTVRQVMQSISLQIDKILLGRALPIEVFGRYAVSGNIATVPENAISIPLTRPMLTAFVQAGDAARRRDLWLKFANAVLFIVGPILVILSCLSERAVMVLLGPNWQGAAPFLAGLALCAIPMLPGLPLNPLAVSCYRSKMVALRVTIEVAVVTPLMLLGIHLGGAMGAIVTKGLAALAMALVTMFFVRGLIQLPLRRQLLALWRTVAGLCVLAVVLLALDGMAAPAGRVLPALWAMFCAGIGGAAYLGVTLLLWRISGRPEAIEALLMRRLGRKLGRKPGGRGAEGG